MNLIQLPAIALLLVVLSTIADRGIAADAADMTPPASLESQNRDSEKCLRACTENTETLDLAEKVGGYPRNSKDKFCTILNAHYKCVKSCPKSHSQIHALYAIQPLFDSAFISIKNRKSECSLDGLKPIDGVEIVRDLELLNAEIDRISNGGQQKVTTTNSPRGELGSPPIIAERNHQLQQTHQNARIHTASQHQQANGMMDKRLFDGIASQKLPMGNTILPYMNEEIKLRHECEVYLFWFLASSILAGFLIILTGWSLCRLHRYRYNHGGAGGAATYHTVQPVLIRPKNLPPMVGGGGRGSLGSRAPPQDITAPDSPLSSSPENDVPIYIPDSDQNHHFGRNQRSSSTSVKRFPPKGGKITKNPFVKTNLYQQLLTEADEE